MDSKRRHAEDDVKLRGLQARIKSCVVKKQENGEKDDGSIEVKEEDKDFAIKEDVEPPLAETSSNLQPGPSSDRDARLIGNFHFIFFNPRGKRRR